VDLEGKRIALLATNGFEDDELTKPLEGIKAAGATVTIISEETGGITGKNGTTVTATLAVEEAIHDDYDGLLLPGGVENPDKLRTNDDAVEFVREFFAAHKPVAAICHAPWLLVEANVVEGRTLTSWPSLKTDLENAGALWVDEEVVTDQGLVTSRNPGDIPAFTAKAIEEFAEGKHRGQTL
jgi:protease I